VRVKPSNKRQSDNFYRFKTRNWWCQSHLTNVEKIVVGLRTESGIVDELECIDVQSMPKMYKNYWSDTVCMEFLNEFLTLVKNQLANIDCPHTVFKFDYEPQTSHSIQFTRLFGLNHLSFLPNWYCDQVQQFLSKQSQLL